MMFKIKPVETYSPHIGVLVSMMTACRYKTLRVIRNLTTEQLDYLWDENANSIGAMLLHLCALEVGYQELSFFGRDLLDNPQLREKWLTSFTLGEEARVNLKGHEIEFYLSQLEETRSKTLELLSEQHDDWLWLEGKQCWSDHITNNYWRWYHVFEDEINHRGQIVWLKSRIPSSLTSN